MTELVFKGQNDQVLTNSLLVAEKFGKEHKHVLDVIRELIQGCAETSADPMFVETIYVNEQNRQEYPMFVMNRDGFTLLAMGFTGKKALKFKLDYIAAFNAMEKALKEQQKPLTSAQMFAMQANINLEHEQRLENVEKRLDAMEQEREKNGKLLLSVSMSSEMLPEISLRNKVRQLVNKYASATNTKQQDVWHKVYEQLYYLYQISIHSYKKIRRDESKLEIAERNHFLDKINIMETRERIISAYNHLKDVGIISSQQNVADRMGIRKESVSKAFSGNKSYLTNTFILKFNNAFDNMFNNDWLMEGKGEMLKNNQSIGDIKNSSVHGVNVNGKDIYLECPFDKNGMEIIVNMINQNQKNIEMFQEQINRLITLLEKKYN